MDEIPALRKSSVRIKDIENVKTILKEFISKGPGGLQVIADFDRTISKYMHNGKLVPTCHNVLNDSDLMSSTYKEEARKMYHKYYPIEIDPNRSTAEKHPYMVEWWTKAHEHIAASGLTRCLIDTVISKADIRLREGSSVLFGSLKAQQVPLLIFSAGIGDIIMGVLKGRSELYDNMKIVSNFLDFDKEGNVVGFEGDIIHIYNKNEGAIHDSDYFRRLAGRRCVLLLGDSVGDLSMARGVEDALVLRIGFLNDKVDARIDNFMDLFDIVLVEDETMDVPNDILKVIMASEKQ